MNGDEKYEWIWASMNGDEFENINGNTKLIWMKMNN